MTDRITPTEFEFEVADLFRLLGYDVVSQLPVSSKRPDSFVVDRYGVGKPNRILVECKRYLKDKIGPDEFSRFLNLVNNSRHDGLVESGIMVSIHGATPAVLGEAQKPTCPVQIMTIAELRDKLFNPRAYLNLALSEWRRDNAIYVNRQGMERGSRAAIKDLRSFVFTLATGAEAGLVILFGGAGTGKSTQLRQLAIDLASAHLEQAKPFVPLYVSLLDFARNTGRSLDRYIFDTLKIFYPEPTPKWSFIKEQISRGSLILLLDGFDEMRNLYKPKSIVAELVNIVSAIGTDGKCFMTCRSPILESESEVEAAFITRPRNRFPELNVRLLDLSPLSPHEVEEYLDLAGRGGLKERILEGEVVDLCNRPILLNFIIDMYGSKRPRKPLSSEDAIIDEAVSFMLENRVETHESSIELSDWRTFLEACALEMSLKGMGYLKQGISDLIEEHFGRELRDDEIRPATAHARTRTLFDLGERGLVFQHLLFRDFLAAFGLAQKLLHADHSSAVLDGSWVSHEILRHLEYAMKQKRQSFSGNRFFEPSTVGNTSLKRGKFCWIPPGLYVTERAPSGGRGAILRYFPSGFLITKMPITISEYREYFSQIPLLQTPSARAHGRLPLTGISFDEAKTIALAGGGRLPTEEEWERAAGWVDGSYPHLAQIASTAEGSEQPPHVGRAAPNPWDLYDATGCVWQWTDTRDAATGINVVKGAYWGADMANKLSIGERLVPNRPRHIRTGLRIVLDPGES